MSLCDDCLSKAEVRWVGNPFSPFPPREKWGNLLTREEIILDRKPHIGECDRCRGEK